MIRPNSVIQRPQRFRFPDVENTETGRLITVGENQSPCAREAGISWTQYHGYDTHVKYMECLSSRHSGQVSLITIGTSSEGRPLKIIKIGDSGSRKAKKSVWMDCGAHAR